MPCLALPGVHRLCNGMGRLLTALLTAVAATLVLPTSCVARKGSVVMADVRRLPPPITPIWEWQMQAACRDMDSAMFFHPSHERGPAAHARDKAAKEICAACPVIDACRRHALTVQESYGVWGGLTARERDVILLAERRQPLSGLTADGAGTV